MSNYNYMRMNGLGAVIACAAVIFTSGCTILSSTQPAWVAAVAGDGPGDQQLVNPEAVQVRNLPKSRSGNRSSYTVFDTEYQVMDSAEGFAERGEASWYGKKFHGRATASGEIYDMHQLTAAHKSLPLPTFVRVTRIDNGQSVIVKVNDRGPFVGDRSIDLSYAAASRLGILENGKSDVYIEALSSHETDAVDQAIVANVPVSNASVVSSSQVSSAALSSAALSSAALSSAALSNSSYQYVQVGAFSDKSNASRLAERMRNSGSLNVGVNHDSAKQLYRVRIGPLAGEVMVREALDSLAAAGIEGYKVLAAN